MANPVLHALLKQASETLRCPELPDEIHRRADELAVASRLSFESAKDRLALARSWVANLGVPVRLEGHCPACGTELRCDLPRTQEWLPDRLSWRGNFMPLAVAQQASTDDRPDPLPSQGSRAKSDVRGRSCTKQNRALRQLSDFLASLKKRLLGV